MNYSQPPKIVNIYLHSSTLLDFLIQYLKIQFGVLKAMFLSPSKLTKMFHLENPI